MKKLILLVAFGVWCLPPTAGWTPAKLRQAKPAVASGPPAPTYLVDQTFEGTGYSNGEGWNGSVGWIADAGSPDPDFSTSGLDMDGSECLKLDSTAATVSLNGYRLFTAGDEFEIYFKWRLAVLPTTLSAIVRLRNDFSTTCSLGVLSSGALYCYGTGGTSQQTVSTVSVNTTYHVWVHWKKSTASNGVLSVGFSTDGIRPVSGNNYTAVTDGTFTAQLNSIYLTHEKDGTAMIGYFDHVLVAAGVQGTIGNSP